MKIHILVHESVHHNEEKLKALVEAIAPFVDLTHLNTARMTRHGILTVELRREEDRPKLLALEGVESVTNEGKQQVG